MMWYRDGRVLTFEATLDQSRRSPQLNLPRVIVEQQSEFVVFYRIGTRRDYS